MVLMHEYITHSDKHGCSGAKRTGRPKPKSNGFRKIAIAGGGGAGSLLKVFAFWAFVSVSIFFR